MSAANHRAAERRVEDDTSAVAIETAQRALEAWLQGIRVLDATVLSGGLMNRNLLVRLDALPLRCVLRLYDRDPRACAKERAVLDLVRSDARVPEMARTCSSASATDA